MIVEITSGSFYTSWRLQIYTETFFPCTQAKLLHLIKIINKTNIINFPANNAFFENLIKGIQEQIDDFEAIKKNPNKYFLAEDDLKRLYRNKALLEKELAKYDKKDL